MNKEQKKESLSKAMTLSTRQNTGESYYHFSDTAPKELVNIFLEHFEVREVDYNIFSNACDTMTEIYASLDNSEDREDVIDDKIYEYGEHASPYTSVRLGYLNVWNQDEITDKVKEYDCDIENACAFWYDEKV